MKSISVLRRPFGSQNLVSCMMCYMHSARNTQQLAMWGFAARYLTGAELRMCTGLLAAVEPAREGDPEQPRLQPEPALPLEVPLHGKGAHLRPHHNTAPHLSSQDGLKGSNGSAWLSACKVAKPLQMRTGGGDVGPHIASAAPGAVTRRHHGLLRGRRRDSALLEVLRRGAPGPEGVLLSPMYIALP